MKKPLLFTFFLVLLSLPVFAGDIHFSPEQIATMLGALTAICLTPIVSVIITLLYGKRGGTIKMVFAWLLTIATTCGALYFLFHYFYIILQSGLGGILLLLGYYYVICSIACWVMLIKKTFGKTNA